MADRWVVLKFGGTSVAGRAQWETIARAVQIRRAEGFRVVVVCSAVAGMTNLLERLADCPDDPEPLDGFIERHRHLSDELGTPCGTWIEQAVERMREAAERLRLGGGEQFRAEMLATGEWLSTRIGAEFLSTKFTLSWQDARDALVAEDEPELSVARRWLSADCRPGADGALQQRWLALEPVVLTQGFVARSSQGHTVLLGRGGSDTSAALIAGRLEADWLEIWSDVPGLFTTDPRTLPTARLLGWLEYEEALEMAASGASVVHPRCIRAAAATATPLHFRDTGRPGIEGTRIERGRQPHDGVKAITCQKDMAVLLLQNIDMRREVGFLARVFDVFRGHGVSVDLVATSETTTTVAVNRAANHLHASALESLVTGLRPHCSVQVHENAVCINLVGTSVRKALSRLAPAFEFFAEHPLLMLSASANDRCLSLLVRGNQHEALLRAAHATLIPAAGEVPGGVFGPAWQDLVRA